jgi:hypothetical protein
VSHHIFVRARSTCALVHTEAFFFLGQMMVIAPTILCTITHIHLALTYDISLFFIYSIPYSMVQAHFFILSVQRKKHSKGRWSIWAGCRSLLPAKCRLLAVLYLFSPAICTFHVVLTLSAYFSVRASLWRLHFLHSSPLSHLLYTTVWIIDFVPTLAGCRQKSRHFWETWYKVVVLFFHEQKQLMTKVCFVV